MPNKIGSNVVAPFERVKDVNVIMTILHPQPLIGLGNLLLVNKVDKPATLKPETATPAVTPTGAGTGTVIVPHLRMLKIKIRMIKVLPLPVIEPFLMT